MAEPKQEASGPLGYIAVARQTRDLRQSWGWTEEIIRTENMLAALENGVTR